jgi:hypothetical protein
MNSRKTYSEKLRDPRWQKKRLQIFERDEFMCVREVAYLHQLRLKLQSTFDMRCAEEVFTYFSKLQDIIYMLWEIGEEEAIEALGKQLQNRKPEPLPKNTPEKCTCKACSGTAKLYVPYKIYWCETCGFIEKIIVEQKRLVTTSPD